MMKLKISLTLLSIFFSFVSTVHAQTEKEICLEKKHSTLEEFVKTQISCSNQNMYETLFDLIVLATDENDALLKIDPDKEHVGLLVPGNQSRPTFTEWRKMLREALPEWKSVIQEKVELIRILGFEIPGQRPQETEKDITCGNLNLEIYVLKNNKKEFKKTVLFVCNVGDKWYTYPF